MKVDKLSVATARWRTPTCNEGRGFPHYAWTCLDRPLVAPPGDSSPSQSALTKLRAKEAQAVATLDPGSPTTTTVAPGSSLMSKIALLTAAVQSRGGPKLAHVVQFQGSAVHAVSSLDDDLFVARNASEQVEVYDARSFSLRRTITVPDLGSGSLAMAVCAHHSCLYVCANDQDIVHRVGRIRRKKAKKRKWPVAPCPSGLSVNNEHNLVVTCREANKIQEYRTDGSLVTEISLQQTGLTCPFQSVQLSTGHYVVSQNTSSGVVIVVGADGQVVHSFDQSSAVGSMSYPRNLAVTRNDYILVADSGNDRILSMDSSLCSVQELALPVDDGIQQPWGLCLDHQSRRRMYVSERIGRYRLLVFNNVKL